MPLSTLALIGATILVSSFVSGVFGMAGGMILLGVLLVYYDVTTAMVLFSIIQFAANGWRAVLWYRYVRWPIFFHYVAGAMVAFAALRLIAYVPDKATVYSPARDHAVPGGTAAQARPSQHRMARHAVRSRER